MQKSTTTIVEAPAKCLWVKMRRVVSMGYLTVDICNLQNDKTSEVIFGSLKQASGQWNLALTGGSSYSDICWKNNIAAHSSSWNASKTPSPHKCQMCQPEMKHCWTYYSQTKKTCFIVCILVSDSLSCSDHNILQFGVQLSMLKINTKTKGLDTRKANFSLLRAQLKETASEASIDDKGASKCWEFFKNTLLEAQKQFIPFEGEGSRQSKKPPWLKCKLLSLLKSRREGYQRRKSR